MTTDKRRMRDIEAELDANRQHMGRTLDALQHRLSTEHMIEQGRSALRASGGDEFVYNLGRSARRNPLPITLLGIGVGWLILASSEQAGRAVARHTPNPDHGNDRGSDISDAAAKARQRTKSTARTLRQNAGQAVNSGHESLDAASDRVGRGAAEVAEKARHGAGRANRAARSGGARLRDGTYYMYREQPLMTSAIGLALGAVLAAGLPRSTAENRALGSARDDFLDSAQEAGREKAGQAQSIAESAAAGAQDAASSEAERQGVREHEN